MKTNYSEIEKIECVCEDAMEAFWKVVATNYPEITDGDFSPSDAKLFENAALTAIKTWIETNCEK